MGRYVAPTWEYDWSTLGDYVSRLALARRERRQDDAASASAPEPPTHAVLNGGLWEKDLGIRNSTHQDALFDGLRAANVTVIYKTTTARWSEQVLVVVDDGGCDDDPRLLLPPLAPYEERMCSLADHCLDLRWTSRLNDPALYREDGTHFNEPVYQWMNQDLLALLGDRGGGGREEEPLSRQKWNLSRTTTSDSERSDLLTLTHKPS